MVEEWRDPRDRRQSYRIDVHTHILPERWPDLKERYGYGGWVKLEHTPCKGKARMFKDDGTPFRNVEDNCWSLHRRIADCDKRNVDVHVLSTVPVMFSYWAKPEHALDLSMMLNDHMAACVAVNPTRFVGAWRNRDTDRVRTRVVIRIPSTQAWVPCRCSHLSSVSGAATLCYGAWSCWSADRLPR